ncbi:MAG TPA: hypothetical protein VFV27_12885 [Nevskiaceae bacterium]|nr:hypothetical protein [Nevskiaceae bacterium]
MGKRAMGFQQALIQETARLICEEQITDYRQAKLKAAERLGIPARGALPENAVIQAAVIEYQRLFGGRAWAEHLVALRRTAVQAMRLLAAFEPRLVGAVTTGATTESQVVRLHGFADKPELLDVFLDQRGIPFESGERRYRYPDGQTAIIPTCEFTAGDIAVEMAVFPAGEQRRPPLSPHDGLPVKRLDLAAAERLAAEPVDWVGEGD